MNEYAYLLADRTWSWSIVGIIAIVVGLFLRSVLLSGMLKRLKHANKKWYKRTQAHYESCALVGWVFFGLFVILTMALWRFESAITERFSLTNSIILLIALLLAALISHVRAYMQAMINAIQGVLKDKDF